MSEKKENIPEEVSIVIPVYNRENYIVPTLESVKTQTHRPLCLIVVDNNSTDNSLAMVREWKRNNESEGFRIEILSEEKPGACAARNRGLSEVATDKVMFFDSDDLMRPELVATALGEFRSHPEAMIVYWSGMRHFAGYDRSSPWPEGDALEAQLVHSILTTTLYMCRTSYFRAAGGWNEEIAAWNDWETGVRLLLPQPSIVGIDRVLVDIMVHDDSITGKSFSSKAGVWERALDAAAAEIRKSGRKDSERLSGIIAYRRVVLAAWYKREGRRREAESLLKVTLQRIESPLRRGLLRVAYHYTAAGGRGASRFVLPLLSK